MIKFSEKDIIMLHDILLKQHGGKPGIRDEGLLESAINNPFQTFNGADLYPIIQEKAASLCYGLINNHPFNDGNKRIGVLAMAMFLEYNGYILKCNDSDLIFLGLGVASGKLQYDDILDWINSMLIK